MRLNGLAISGTICSHKSPGANLRSTYPLIMAFHITHRYGNMDGSQSVSAFSESLRELDDRPEDTEHNSVAVTHESEWCISVSRGGNVTFEHLEGGGERHMCHVTEAKIVELWNRLAEGDVAALEREPWKPGYPWQSRFPHRRAINFNGTSPLSQRRQ